MLHSIQNADGTVSIIQVDPNNQIITLPDGTTAQVQGIATVSLNRRERERGIAYLLQHNTLVNPQLTQQSDGSTVHTVQGLDTGHDNMTVDLTEATLGQDGQIIITGEDGHGNYSSNASFGRRQHELNLSCFRLSGLCERYDHPASVLLRVPINGGQHSADPHERRRNIMHHTNAGTKNWSPKRDFDHRKQCESHKWHCHQWQWSQSAISERPSHEWRHQCIDQWQSSLTIMSGHRSEPIFEFHALEFQSESTK